MRTLLLFGAALVPAAAAQADDKDVLRLLLSKSDLAVAGEITNVPSGLAIRSGASLYTFKVKVSDALKGHAKEGDELTLTIERFEAVEGDDLPDLRKGAKCVFFLKATRAQGGWKEADGWFGVQPYNSGLARTLQRIAEEPVKLPKE